MKHGSSERGALWSGPASLAQPGILMAPHTGPIWDKVQVVL